MTEKLRYLDKYLTPSDPEEYGLVLNCANCGNDTEAYFPVTLGYADWDCIICGFYNSTDVSEILEELGR